MGGARARSGPTADPSSYKQLKRQGDWSLLPGFYSGTVPDWPLSRNHRIPVKDEDGVADYIPIHDEEMGHWERLWCKGQGVMWRRNHQEDRVARLCRLLAIADVQLDVTRSAWMAEIRQLEEDLGLSQSGMLRNKWRYEPEDQGEEEQGEQPAAAPRQATARARMSGLKVVE